LNVNAKTAVTSIIVVQCVGIVEIKMFAKLVTANIVQMKIKEVVDYFYGLDPAHLSYTHKVGDIYGKKNLKVPHAKLHRSKKVTTKKTK